MVALIRVPRGRAAARSSLKSSNRWNRIQRRLQHLRAVHMGDGDHSRERDALPVYRDVALGPGFAPVGRVRPGRFTPRVAGTRAESRMARVQSLRTRRPSRLRRG